MTRCVRLEPLDEHREPIKSGEETVQASGFLTHGIWDNVQGDHAPESGALHLYTCWHVVAGHDPRNTTTPVKYTPRKFLRITGIGVDGPNSVSSSESLTIPLFDKVGQPVWEQEPEESGHLDFNALGLKVPKNIDVVRLNVDLEKRLVERWAIDPSHTSNEFFELGEDVFVCGFPHGFSAVPDTQVPIFLKRSVASRVSSKYQITLLDTGCLPVMSGGAVFRRIGEKWRLAGMYSGTIFTNCSAKDESERQASALGTVTSFEIIKQSIGTVKKPFNSNI